MCVWTPECVVKLGKNLCARSQREVVLARTRHGLEREAETGERIGLPIAGIGVHGTQKARREE